MQEVSQCLVLLPIHLFDSDTLIQSLKKYFFLDKQTNSKEQTNSKHRRERDTTQKLSVYRLLFHI